MSEGNAVPIQEGRRLPSEDFQLTEIIHSIFDRSVGSCYAGFSCSYNRQHGRLYVAKNAVLFYSNMFGFERQLCMFLTEVTEIKIYRSTSIWVSMMDGEEFIFKSLSDRERVVALVVRLMNHLPLAETHVQQELNAVVPESLEASLPLSPTRDRARSCPSDMNRSISLDLDIIVEHDDRQPERKVSTGELSADTSSCTENLLDAWNKEKQSGSMYTAPTVDSLKLNCSVSDFFDRFLSDDAPFSIPRYQAREVGDSSVKATKWVLDDAGYMTRKISFIHPISNSLGIGPSSARAERVQKLRRFGDFGLSMATVTNVRDIPACDAFHTTDKWFVDGIDDNNVSFSVLNETVFTKRSMLKRVIQSSVATEVRGWYEGYTAMLLSTLSGQRKEGQLLRAQVLPAVAPAPKTSRCTFAMILLLLSVLILIMSAVLVQNYMLRVHLEYLRAELLALRRDQETTTKILDEIMVRLG
jgi:hypothetical protein